MRNKHIVRLFYLHLTFITLVNGILIYGLFSYFVLGQSIDRIDWLIGVFAAEVIGCSVYTCRKIFSSDIQPIIFSDISDPKPQIIEGRDGLPSAQLPVASSENPNNPNEILRQRGLNYLREMRKSPYSSLRRKKLAKKAKAVFRKLPKEGIYYHIFLFNTGTVEMELGNYSNAIKYYKQAKDVLLELELTLNPLEFRKRLSTTENRIGNIFGFQNLTTDARTQYSKAWIIEPDFIIALNLFEISEKLQDKGEMKTWWRILSLFDEYRDDNYKLVVRSIEDRMKDLSD